MAAELTESPLFLFSCLCPCAPVPRDNLVPLTVIAF